MSSCSSFYHLLHKIQNNQVNFELNILSTSCSQLFFPTNLESLKTLSHNLINCYKIHTIEIHLFHAVSFLFLQTWCIPGTSLFNLFGGAVFGIYYGTAICLIVKCVVIFS
jgi:hypothetical protein